MIKGVIGKIGFTRMLVILMCLVLFFSVISSLILYKSIHIPLGPHFAAAYQNLANLQENLLFKTILINLIFFSITALGVLLLGILYSHRIAGPFIKITRFARSVGDGHFDQRIYFRKNDAVHSLAIALNEMVQSYETRCNEISCDLDKIEENLNTLRHSDLSKEQINEEIKQIRKFDATIFKRYKEMSL